MSVDFGWFSMRAYNFVVSGSKFDTFFFA